MRKLVFVLLWVWLLAVPVSSLEIRAPTVPEDGRNFMPRDTDNLGAGLEELLEKCLETLIPELNQASDISLAVICAVLMISILGGRSGPVKLTAQFAGTIVIGSLLMNTADSMIELGADTVLRISDYGKLLLPVMTTALAAQGGISTSGALYAGTALFDAVLTDLMSRVLVPGIWLFLTVSIVNSATGEDMLKRIGQFIKGTMIFFLKTLLTVFTTYLSLTGVVSGVTDAAALKAAKLTISSVVPVVGGIISDASEAILVSTSILRSAAGIYGIFAVLALFLGPFVKIGAHYLILKLTAAICGIFGEKSTTNLIDDFSGAMGLLLAMTGCACIMTLISTVCFLRGIGK